MAADPGDEDPTELDARASVLMKTGIQQLNDGSTESAAAALEYFNHALSLRRRLPIDAVPVFRYGLAACLLNRADALVRLGDADSLSTALDAYDEAISLLKALRLGDDPRFARRLAMAYQNRGVALQFRDAADPGAIVSFTDALAVLDSPDAADVGDREYLRAASLVNLANALVVIQTPDAYTSARQAAAEAMRLVGEAESGDVDAAEVGLKARHIFCRTVAPYLPAAQRTESLPEVVHEVTDAVDDGLRLVRLWEQKDVSRFRPVAADLLQFGAIVYAAFQPQFVDEFVRENLDPAAAPSAYLDSVEMRAAIGRIYQALGKDDEVADGSNLSRDRTAP
ncbi:MAG TPA: hypothetical protein VLV86_06130 [Vicinamibacterales bacterium]|nr:hypothetical protein [Vicinamibacterales bacterium]